MSATAFDALHAAQRPTAAPSDCRPRMLVAGATGALGVEVVRRLAGLGRSRELRVLAREPLRAGLRGVLPVHVAGDDPAAWPSVPVDVALVLFEPPRLFHDRERALWTPTPTALLPLARWLHGCGAHTLAIVLPHDQGRLPAALRAGLASLDEQAVAALGFERLVLIRSARVAQQGSDEPWLVRLGHRLLRVARYMVPDSERPVRAAQVAALADAALRLAPPGIHIASPQTVWQAAQGDLERVARQWLLPRESDASAA